MVGNAAKFSIGSIVKHRHFNFRGVIHDVDFEFNNSEEWYQSIPKNVRLTEKTKNMFFTASYDIDRFKRFVFESSFLTLYDIDPKVVEEIKKDEIALLSFSFKWLKWLLFKEGEFKLNETAAQQRQEKAEEE
jgi:heat shock protein HspQ